MINTLSALSDLSDLEAGEGEKTSSQISCQHKEVKLYEAPNPAGLAVCLGCGSLIGGL